MTSFVEYLLNNCTRELGYTTPIIFGHNFPWVQLFSKNIDRFLLLFYDIRNTLPNTEHILSSFLYYYIKLKLTQ